MLLARHRVFSLASTPAGAGVASGPEVSAGAVTYDKHGPLRGPKVGIGYPPTEVEGLRRRKFRSSLSGWAKSVSGYAANWPRWASTS
jgi:hypothetical protein